MVVVVVLADGMPVACDAHSAAQRYRRRPITAPPKASDVDSRPTVRRIAGRRRFFAIAFHLGLVSRGQRVLVGRRSVAMTAIALVGVVDHPEVMLGVLIVVLRRDTVALRGRVAGQGKIPLEHLVALRAPGCRGHCCRTSGCAAAVCRRPCSGHADAASCLETLVS